MKVTTTWGNLTTPKPGETIPVWVVRWTCNGREWVRKFYAEHFAEQWASAIRLNGCANITIEATREPR